MTTTSAPATQPVAAPSVDTAMRRAMLDSMMSSPYGVDAIWLLVMVSIWSAVPEPRALILTIAYGTMAAIRYGFNFLYARRKPADDHLEVWLRALVVVSIGIGLGWAAQTLVLLGPKPGFVWVLPLVTLGVMVVNAAYARAAYAPAALAFIVPALLPVSIGLMWQDDPIARGLGIGCLVYMLTASQWARSVNRRLRERFAVEAELRAALARNVELQEQLERGRGMLGTVLDNLDDGVELYNSADRRVFGDAAIRRLHDIPEDVYARATTARDMIAWRFDRGEYGPEATDRAGEIERRVAALRDPATGAIQQSTVTGRTVELRFKRLPDGGMLATHRDITRLKRREDELAAAKEEAERARAETAQALGRLQVVIDNMSDGVMLFDRDLRWAIDNQKVRDLLALPKDVAHVGATSADIQRFQIQRGDFGPIEDVEADIQEWLDRRRNAPNLTYTRWTAAGRFLEYTSRPLPNGEIVATYRDITELKRHEEELATAKEEAERARNRLEDAIRALPSGFSLHDEEARLVVYNDSYERYFGNTPGLLKRGERYEDLLREMQRRGTVRPEHRERGEAWIAEMAAHHRSSFGDREMATAAERWIRISKHPTREGGVVTLVTDLTEAKARERELARARDEAEAAGKQAADARLRLVDAIESLPNGFVLFDAEGRLVLANQRFLEYYAPIADLAVPGARIEDMLRQAAIRGAVSTGGRDVEDWVETRMAMRRNPGAPRETRQPDGRWVVIGERRTRDGGVASIYTDISELKRREMELEQARDAAEAASRDAANARTRLVDAIEALPHGFVLFDVDDRLVLTNQRFLEYYAEIADITVPGVHVREMLREAARRGAVSTGDRSVEDWLETRMAMRRNPGAPVETRQPNGRWIVIGERRTREGGLAGIYTDISELKRREAELEQARDEAEAANQSKSTFLATMSHEIRTPMNGVLGMMEILERQGVDEEQRPTVETMRESAQALLRIIDDVLDFSKIDAGRLELESTAFSLSGVIEGAMAAMRPQGLDKGLTLTADIDPGSSDALEGDPGRVRQILINLLGNAVKFTERGFVRMAASTAPLGDGRIRVSLSVADSGIGMDDAQLSRLFEPFAQADSSTTRRYGGTGLGLSIVRRLAQLMEGDVNVESKLGAGTTFRITLVLRAAPADSPLRAITPLAARARRRQPAESAARVLVVDDHPVNLKVLVKQLQMLGIAADTAVDGVEALAMWRAGHYAVVLADVHMPRMDGYELADAIRREEAAMPGNARHTPIVAVTANAMRGEEERCLAAGMDAYLAKPVSFDRLRAALSRWLRIDADDEASAAADTRPAIDESTLRAWLGDDPATLNEVLRDFLRDAWQSERDIGASLGAGDLPRLAATAHRLKGSALAIGARRLADAAAGLEQAGRTGDRAACQDGLGALAGELRRVAEEIGG